MSELDKFEKTIGLLKERFEGKLNLNKQETAIALGISQSSINRRIAENDFANLPKFTRYGGSKAKYVFPLAAMAIFIADRS